MCQPCNLRIQKKFKKSRINPMYVEGKNNKTGAKKNIYRQIYQ